MTTESPNTDPNVFTRRTIVTGALKTMFAASVLPALSADAAPAASSPRCVNIMNFIRAEEPREPMDLMLSVREQIALI